VVGGAILDHYSAALGDIAEVGFTAYWQREFRPYLRAAAEHFSPERTSLTDRLFGRGPESRSSVRNPDLE
jgi:hypothetical protein